MTNAVGSGSNTDHVFVKEADAEAFIRAKLSDLHLTGNELSTLVSETKIATKTEYKPEVPPGGAPALVARYRWVIKSKDLALMDSILEGMRAGASAGFFGAMVSTNTAILGGALGLVTAIYKLARNVVREGAFLDPDTYTILAAIKSAEPISEATLLSRLRETNGKMTKKHLRSLLTSLKSAPAQSGEPKQFVTQDPDERWRSVGL
jgi:hypothetical protein